MNVRDLIPWSRQHSTAPAIYPNQEGGSLFGLGREVDRLFDNLLRGTTPSLGSGGAVGAWPHLEVTDSEQEVRVTAELPGMNEKDVELLVEDGVLTVRGEKKSETEDKERGYSERFYGRFERRIALPSNVEEEGAKAAFRDGVLTVTLPKSSDAARGRRIAINADTRH